MIYHAGTLVDVFCIIKKYVKTVYLCTFIFYRLSTQWISLPATSSRHCHHQGHQPGRSGERYEGAIEAVPTTTLRTRRVGPGYAGLHALHRLVAGTILHPRHCD